MYIYIAYFLMLFHSLCRLALVMRIGSPLLLPSCLWALAMIWLAA